MPLLRWHNSKKRIWFPLLCFRKVLVKFVFLDFTYWMFTNVFWKISCVILHKLLHTKVRFIKYSHIITNYTKSRGLFVCHKLSLRRQTRQQRTYNVTSWSVRVTIVAIETQQWFSLYWLLTMETRQTVIFVPRNNTFMARLCHGQQ
jgi:hypothetical protein